MIVKSKKKKDDSLFVVSKDKRLYDFKEYNDLTINESRILNSYLAKINYKDRKTAKRHINVKWITDMFHLKTDVGILKAVETFKEHNRWTNDSTGETIEVFEMIELGLNSDYEKMLILKCTPEAEEYFFPTKRFTAYSIKNITKLKSHKCVTFYELLVDLMNLSEYKDKKGKSLAQKGYNYYNSFKPQYRVDNLIKKLGLNPEKCKNYTDLQNNFFRDCVEKINSDTDISIKIEKKRLRRKTEKISIDIERKSKIEKEISEINDECIDKAVVNFEMKEEFNTDYGIAEDDDEYDEYPA